MRKLILMWRRARLRSKVDKLLTEREQLLREREELLHLENLR